MKYQAQHMKRPWMQAEHQAEHMAHPWTEPRHMLYVRPWTGPRHMLFDADLYEQRQKAKTRDILIRKIAVPLAGMCLALAAIGHYAFDRGDSSGPDQGQSQHQEYTQGMAVNFLQGIAENAQLNGDKATCLTAVELIKGKDPIAALQIHCNPEG